MPAWWNFHFWNTQFLIEAKKDHAVFKVMNGLIALGLIAGACFILRDRRKPLLLFITNLVLSLVLAIAVMPLTVTRYAGFIFIGFLAAWWLYCEESPQKNTDTGTKLINGLLSLQVVAGLFAIITDIRLPFANLYHVNECIAELPPHAPIVTDYWTMNAMVAYTDRPAYCIDMGKTISFVLWDPDVAALRKNKYRYTTGLQTWFDHEKTSEVYMLSLASPTILAHTDSLLYNNYRIVTIDSKQGAIEKGSDLYLYKISKL
jgi:hypothetical protein